MRKKVLKSRALQHFMLAVPPADVTQVAGPKSSVRPDPGGGRTTASTSQGSFAARFVWLVPRNHTWWSDNATVAILRPPRPF